MGITCEGCGRTLPDKAPQCVYCGWSENAKIRQLVEATRVIKEKFRTHATLLPLVLSALILTVFALLFLVAKFVTAALCLLPGPLLVGIHLLWRNRRPWVEIQPGQGLAFSNHPLVPWTSIASLEYQPGMFSAKDTAAAMRTALPNRKAARFGCFIIPILVICLVFLPALFLLSHRGPRVVITLKNGERIILHDLEEPGHFVRTVQFKLGWPISGTAR